MKRKFSAYILLAVIVFHTSGFYLVFEVNRLLVKHRMRAVIASAVSLKIERIAVTGHPRYIKLHGKKEIEFGGRMFDVVHKSVHGDTTVYYCIQDVREDLINAGIAKMMKDHTRHLLIPVFGFVAVLTSQYGIKASAPTEIEFHSFAPGIFPANNSPLENPPKAC